MSADEVARDGGGPDCDDASAPVTEGPIREPVPISTFRRRVDAARQWLVVIAVAVGAALLIRTFVLQQFSVSGYSMVNTLHDGDRVLVNKLSYRLHEPRRGDVIVLETSEGASERDLIKRVVALPGETVAYRSCLLFIDGKRQDEPYLSAAVVGSTNCGTDQAPLQIPSGHVFVLGDNRPASKDSRDPSVGPIDYDKIVGRAFVVIWPAGDWRWL
ncbi:MAG TPA: signal peptidase I [Ilumatobacteraceae bacterium]|nr:signal peptidase I [Ilumatobacteraceae bacterium]